MAVRTVACLPAIIGSWRHPGGGTMLSTSGTYDFAMERLVRADLAPPGTRLVNMNHLGEALAGELPGPTKPAPAIVLARLPDNSLFERVPEIWPSPPTHFKTNKYTVAFQEFVNTYGVPRYGEANPALFTAATFPFLFGVMYGDIGHGSVLTLASLYLVWTEKKGDLSVQNLR
jgi:hypothetical protein